MNPKIILQKRAYKRKKGREGTPGGAKAKHAWRLLCLESASAGALANIPIEEDILAHFTKACILCASSFLNPHG